MCAMDDIRSSVKRFLFLGEEGTGKTTTIKFLSWKAKSSINDLELYELTFKGQEICLIDGKTILEYKKRTPDNTEVDIVVLVLSPKRLKLPFEETEMQMKDTFGEHFRKKFLFLFICDPQTSGDFEKASDETDNLICNADTSFQRLYKRYCWNPLTIELPHYGFLHSKDLFENLIEMNSEKTNKSKKNGRSAIKVVVITDGKEASLVSNIALSVVSKTEKVDFYDFENTKEKSTFIDTPPLKQLLANKDFFKDAFSTSDTVILLIKESKILVPTLFPKLEDAFGQTFYDRLLIGINLLGKDSKKYSSIRDTVFAMMKIFMSDPRLFSLPDLAACCGKELLSDITKPSEGKNKIFEKSKRCFVLIPGRDNDPKEDLMKEIDPEAECVEIGDTKLWEVQTDDYCIIFMNTPLMNENDIHKSFLQICKDGVNLIILDEANESFLEYLKNLFPKDVNKYFFQCTSGTSQHRNQEMKNEIVHKLGMLSSPIKMRDCHVLFIGENGSGKSSSINTIVGRSLFGTGHIWSMTETITKDVQRYTCVNENYNVAFGKNITLIDTPNFTTLKGNQDFTKAIHFGIDVVVMVVKIDRLTPYRLSFFEKVPQLFTGRVFDHLMIVFTSAEQLGDENFDTFLETGGQQMSQFMKNIQRRHVVFSNTSRDVYLLQQQREEFLRQLDLIVKSNTGNVLSTLSK